MRKLITAGLAALLLAAALPSHADAMGGGRRGKGGGKSAKASRSSASWAQPKASAKKRGGTKKSVGATSKLPAVKVPALTGTGKRRAGAVNTGSPSSASLKHSSASVKVDYKAGEDNKKVPKLVNGGLGGGGGGSVSKGGGKKKSGGGKKGKKG